MASPFTLWGLSGSLFTGASGPVAGQKYASSQVSGGGAPIWTETRTPAAAFVAGAANPYTLVIATQDWLGDVQPEIALAVESGFVNPFAADAGAPFGNLAGTVITSSTPTQGTGGALYWTASATPGAYALKFQPLTVSYPSAPPAANLVTLAGAATTMLATVTNPARWSYLSENASNIVVAYTVPTSGTTESLVFAGFSGSGVPASQATVATSLPKDTPYSIGFSSVAGYSYRYLSLTGPGGAGLYGGFFGASTGQVGTPSLQLALPGYTAFTGLAAQTMPNGDTVRFVEGVVNGANVLQTFLNASSIPQSTFTLASPADYFQTARVYDPLDGKMDFLALAYTDAGQVHLELLDQQGAQIGTDLVIAGLTSFLRLHTLTGAADSESTRVEIEYLVTTASGQVVNALIYDSATEGAAYALSGGGLRAGTTYDDTFDWGVGVYTIDGAGGLDTLAATSLTSSQVTLGFDSALNVVMRDTSGDSVTLRNFEALTLANETVTLTGRTLAFSASAAPASITNFGFGTYVRLQSLAYSGPYRFALLSRAGGVGSFALQDAGAATVANINFTGSFSANNLVAFSDGGAGTSIAFYSAAARKQHFFNDAPNAALGGLLWYNSASGSVLDWRLQNGAVISSTPLAGFAPNSGWSIAGTADLTGDGVTDVLLNFTAGGQTSIGDWVVANGTYSAFRTIGGFAANSGWSQIGTGDFNGDGVADVLLKFTSGANVSLYDWQVSNGQLIATNNLNMGYTLTSGWTTLGTGDFNGDGTTDILLQNTQSGLVADWAVRSNAASAFTSLAGVAPGSGWSFDGIGDFNGDGTSDILWQNGSALAIWEVSNGSVLASVNVSLPAPSALLFKGIGDYGGHGASDILWQNPTTGQTVIWEMSGGTVAATDTPGGADPASWRIV